MKKIVFLTTLILLVAFFSPAQEAIRIHSADRVMYEASILEIEEIRFKKSTSVFNFDSGNMLGIPLSEIDSITFSEAVTDTSDRTIYIMYNDDYTTVINPLSEQGVSIAAEQCQVSITSHSEIYGVEYHISGSSNNASLSITSDKDFVLILSNLNLTNSSGPALIVNSEVTSNINITGSNILTDNVLSSKSGAIRSKGDIVFSGQGSLNINGLVKHAISSERTVTVESGNITVLQAITDGVHSEGFIMNGGSLDIHASGDAIDSGTGPVEINDGTLRISSTTDDVKGIKSDASIAVNGGIINMNIAGSQSKGISSKQNIVFNGGNISIVASGKTVLETSGSGYEPSYCSAVKCTGNLTVNSGNITIETTLANDGGKGFSADGEIMICGGIVGITTRGNGATYKNASNTTDSYTSTCIKSDTNISILSGTVTCNSSGTGGKGISAGGTITIGAQNAVDNALILNVSTSGEHFLVSGSSSGGGGRPGGGGMGSNANYANPKAIKCEGNLTVNSGMITVSCTQNDEGGEGLESKSILTINGGNITINTYDDCINASSHIQIAGGTVYCVSTGNDAIDSNGTLSISGGITISNGASQPEGGFDCDNNRFAITGGIMIGTGGSNSSPTTSACTQRTIKYTGTAGNAICVKKTSGEIILLYQMPSYQSSGNSGGGFPGGGNSSSMTVLFSDPNLSTGSYTLQYGGTISGGTTVNGYNTGGTYSGGSSKSFTISSMLTTVQ